MNGRAWLFTVSIACVLVCAFLLAIGIDDRQREYIQDAAYFAFAAVASAIALAAIDRRHER